MQAQLALNVEDLSDRPGFDAQFLGARVGIPALNGLESVLLPYTHFSVLRRLDKRLAAVTALGMDGTKLIDLARSGTQWRLDPRLRPGTTDRRGPDAHCFSHAHRPGRLNLAAS